MGTPKGPVSDGSIPPPAAPHAAMLITRATALPPVQSIVPLLPLENPSTKTKANPTICKLIFVPPGTLAVGQNGVGGVPGIVALQTSHIGQETNARLVEPTVPFGRWYLPGPR